MDIRLKILTRLIDMAMEQPEQRLGQLLENVFGCERHGDKCIFGMRDEELAAKLGITVSGVQPGESQ